MSKIQVVSKESHKILEIETKNNVLLSEASIVLININKEDVSEIKQVGKNAVYHLKNGERL